MDLSMQEAEGVKHADLDHCSGLCLETTSDVLELVNREVVLGEPDVHVLAPLRHLLMGGNEVLTEGVGGHCAMLPSKHPVLVLGCERQGVVTREVLKIMCSCPVIVVTEVMFLTNH